MLINAIRERNINKKWEGRAAWLERVREDCEIR